VSVSGKDFIDFAERCVAFGDEIGYRNAVGRSYYGVYHEICSKLEHCYVLTSHEGVRNYLLSTASSKKEPYDTSALRSVGAILHQMHVQRKWADYELGRELHKSDAEATLKIAKDAMTKIKILYEAVYPPPAA